MSCSKISKFPVLRRRVFVMIAEMIVDIVRLIVGLQMEFAKLVATTVHQTVHIVMNVSTAHQAVSVVEDFLIVIQNLQHVVRIASNSPTFEPAWLRGKRQCRRQGRHWRFLFQRRF